MQVPWRPVPKHSNTSRLRAHANKTQPDKMLPITFRRKLRNPLKRYKKGLRGALWRPVPKHPKSSRIRAHAKQNPVPQNASRYLWNPCQSFCLAPSVRGWFRNHWRKSFGGRFRNTRTAAGFEPMPSKMQPDKMLPVTFGTHKKQFFCPAPTVRGWFPNHWRKSLGGRFRNTRTAAGFEPMPSKTQPDKMLPDTFGTHKKQFFCLAPSVRGWFRNHWCKSLGGRFRNIRTAAGFEPLRFAWHGLESCCCSSVSEPASKGLAPMVWEPASHRGCRTKELFFMGSKGNGKHFVGLHFAWHGLESCCCSGVSEPASKGLAPMVSEPASHRGCQTKGLAWVPKVTGSILWDRVLLGMGSNPAALRVFRNRPPKRSSKAFFIPF